ncbi:MAG: hypothetical protein QUV05_17645, partial [Phycisphaerae bacterium]|nr:hypothetical protein [Phycisphaerae bacterium]
ESDVYKRQPEGFPLATELDPPAMTAAMGQYFITGGLVSHWQGKTDSAEAGNAALDAGAGEMTGESLYTVATALPDTFASGFADGEAVSRLRGIRLFPRTHGFLFSAATVGDLCRWLSERRLPLFIWHTEIEWRDLRELARAFGDLSIVVESQPRKIIYCAEPLLDLLRSCPSAFVETSNLTAPLFQEVLKSVGAERLIYGSFMPMNDPLVPLGVLLDSDMPDADRTLVAGGNLKRLIGAVA